MTATRKATSEEIGKIVHDAIVFAHEDYEEISHGAWLWTGAEYYLTVTIAHQLFEKLGGEYPALVEYPIYQAEGKYLDSIIKTRPGRKTKALPRRSRVDCVLLDPDWWPAAAIEVKTEIKPARIKTDIKRLIEIVSNSKPRRKFPGIFAYWASEGGENAKSVLEARVPNMDGIVDCLIAKYNEKIERKNRKRGTRQRKLKRLRTFHTVKIDKDYDHDAYLAYCVVIEKN